MDTTLVINPGSSSKKYAFFREGRAVCTVRFERTGETYGTCVAVRGIEERCEGGGSVGYETGLRECLRVGIREGVISRPEDITRIGIRIVAPHSYFRTHRRIDDRCVAMLRSMKERAPLHIPFLLEEIEAVQDVLPHAVLLGISDSAFHHTIPPYAALYSVPKREREQEHLYRYGYHGLSVASVVRVVLRQEGSMPPRIIVAHVGSGVSVTAVHEGKSIDTTMGFSPTSGLIMSSRGGDIDAGLLIHIMRTKKYTLDEAETYLTLRSGLQGIAGSSDLRIVLDRMMRGDHDAILGERAFFYGLHKVLHAYEGILGGLDVLILTGTAAERNAYVRKRLLEAFAQRGCVIDTVANEECHDRDGLLTTRASSVRAYVCATREMDEIAREAEAFTLSL